MKAYAVVPTRDQCGLGTAYALFDCIADVFGQLKPRFREEACGVLWSSLWSDAL